MDLADKLKHLDQFIQGYLLNYKKSMAIFQSNQSPLYSKARIIAEQVIPKQQRELGLELSGRT
jgi:hypothetical protein